MADINVTVQQVTTAGVAPSYTSLNAADTYYVSPGNDDVVLHFKNTNASPSTVTFDVTQTVDGLALVDPTVNVPATTGDVMVGPLPQRWTVASGANAGKVKFSQTVATGCSVAAVRA